MRIRFTSSGFTLIELLMTLGVFLAMSLAFVNAMQTSSNLLVMAGKKERAHMLMEDLYEEMQRGKKEEWKSGRGRAWEKGGFRDDPPTDVAGNVLEWGSGLVRTVEMSPTDVPASDTGLMAQSVKIQILEVKDDAVIADLEFIHWSTAELVE